MSWQLGCLSVVAGLRPSHGSDRKDFLSRFEEETCRSWRWLGQETGHSKEAFMTVGRSEPVVVTG
jgi:hypothetical protein